MAKKEKKVAIAKGVKIAESKKAKERKKPGMSNLGKYKNISKSDFAGPVGTFPIDSISRARNALSRKHFASDPDKIERAVYKKYPELKKRKIDREGKKSKK